ncbi:MAG: DUF192 domain-containing protein [Phycisphaerales bacterium]
MAAGRFLNITGLILCLLLTAGCPDQKPAAEQGTQTVPVAQAEESTTQAVTIKSETFTLELALDDASRLQGLSDRAEIADDGGMLFVFPKEAVREFVMRRCLVPIDIAFLNAHGEVVWMHAMQIESDPNTPEYRLKRYSSHYPAQFAIELKEGTIRRLGLAQGDRIDLPVEALKGRVR